MLLLLSNCRRLDKSAGNLSPSALLYIAYHPLVPALIHCIASAWYVQLVLPCS